MLDISQFVRRNARQDPSGPACIDPATDRRTTHAQLDDRVDRLASGLCGELGLEPGDRVAILSQNCAEYLEVYYAAARAGVVAQPLNWRLSTEELGRVLNDGSPRAVLYSGAFDEQVEALNSVVDADHWLRFVPGEASPYEDLLARSAPERLDPRRASSDDDPFFVLYTGGTTGISKGAVHTHRSTLTSMVNQNAAERVQPSDVYLLLGQMFHIPVVLAMNFVSLDFRRAARVAR